MAKTKEESREYYLQHVEERRASARAYYYRHREECLARCREYRKEHPIPKEDLKVYRIKQKLRYRNDEAFRLRHIAQVKARQQRLKEQANVV